MSLRLRLLNLWLRRVEKPALARTDPLVLRRRFERTARLLFRPPRGTVATREDVAGVPVLRLRGPGVARGSARLLYAHGGAFVMGSSRTHAGFAARLSARLGLEVLLPDYALAPERPYPAGLDDLARVWSATNAVYLSGDSAGGQLALALLDRLAAEGGRTPRATFVFSPFTDFGDREGSRRAYDALDPLLSVSRLDELRRLYLGSARLTEPGISPVRGAFRGTGPVWIAVGSTEILYDDARAMAERLEADGVAVTLHVATEAPHVWPFFPWLPEAGRTLDALADWLSPLSRAPGDS